MMMKITNPEDQGSRGPRANLQVKESRKMSRCKVANLEAMVMFQDLNFSRPKAESGGKLVSWRSVLPVYFSFIISIFTTSFRPAFSMFI
jgi:hypothetical protein